jgi:hypothetical protein
MVSSMLRSKKTMVSGRLGKTAVSSRRRRKVNSRHLVLFPQSNPIGHLVKV